MSQQTIANPKVPCPHCGNPDPTKVYSSGSVWKCTVCRRYWAKYVVSYPSAFCPMWGLVPTCQGPFTPTSKNQRFCSEPCTAEATKIRQNRHKHYLGYRAKCKKCGRRGKVFEILVYGKVYGYIVRHSRRQYDRQKAAASKAKGYSWKQIKGTTKEQKEHEIGDCYFPKNQKP
jgi:hypothetical protein